MDSLEKIFQNVSKVAKDGKKYILFKDQSDILFLYGTGFVDAKKYTAEDWLKSFEPSKQKDGSYIVSQEQWSSKKKYHYRGPVPPPWDPMTLPEKDYTEKEFAQIFQDKVLPCTLFEPSYLKTVMNNLKASGQLVNGKLKVDKGAKEDILKLINEYPSPMRVLQVSVHSMIRQQKGKAAAAQGALQKSGFAEGKAAEQITSARLSDLVKAAPIQGEAPSKTKEAAISIKDLKKKRTTPGKV